MAPAGQTAASSKLTQGMNLYGKSARNLWPRVLSSLAIAAVLFQSAGPWWTAGWLFAVWGGLGSGIWLVSAYEQQTSPRKQAALAHLVTANNVIATIFQAVALAAIWALGDDLGRAFSIVA